MKKIVIGITAAVLAFTTIAVTSANSESPKATTQEKSDSPQEGKGNCVTPCNKSEISCEKEVRSKQEKTDCSSDAEKKCGSEKKSCH